jgi:hypothetical protein
MKNDTIITDQFPLATTILTLFEEKINLYYIKSKFRILKISEEFLHLIKEIYFSQKKLFFLILINFLD